MKYFSLALLLTVSLFGCQLNSQPTTTTATIGDTTLTVKVVQKPLDLYRGLSGRPSLGPDQGMFFVLPQTSIASFVMREMRFPLDMIWIRDGVIVDITKNIPTPTSTELTIYQPNQPVSHVLEVNAGWADEHGIQIGDPVTWPTN